MADDDIRPHPVVSWTMGTLPRSSVLLTLGLLRPEQEQAQLTTEELKTLERFLHVGMSASQADQLAGDLRTYAALSRERGKRVTN